MHGFGCLSSPKSAACLKQSRSQYKKKIKKNQGNAILMIASYKASEPAKK